MYSEVAWVLVTSGTQVPPQIIFETGYLPDYISVAYDYAAINISRFLNDFISCIGPTRPWTPCYTKK